MSELMPFWRFLETRPSRTAVMGEWQTLAGDLLSAIRPLLQPLGKEATAYPNPRPDGRPMKIVRHNDGTIVAIDEDDYQNRLDLKPKDVVLYQSDLRKLRVSLCGSLSCVNIAKTPVDQATHCLQIGNWEPKKAASFPVYLLFCRHRGALRKEMLNLIARFKKPDAILLTPTQMNWDSNLDRLARSKNMLLVSLSEVIQPVDGSFSETLAWEGYLRAFCQMIDLDLPSNYRNRKPIARRAELAAKAEKIKRALVEHIRSAKDYVFASIDAGRGAKLLRFLTKTELARLAGVQPYHITRCFKADPQLIQLYEMANDPEQLIKYGR